MTTPKPLHITSTSFRAKESIPSKYTCEGSGVNPPLEGHLLAYGELMGLYKRMHN